MGTSPLVSVIVPTYKRPDYLKLTLESIVSQTYQNLEVLVVDDGSPGDENEQLCSQWPKVRYQKIENSGGPATPRNVGLKAAKGTYIAFTDDDDVWLPKKLETQVAILEAHSEFGLVHGPCDVIDEKGVKTGQQIGVPGDVNVKHGDVKLRMMGNWTLMMPTPLVRKSVLDEVGFFSEDIPAALEDVEFWVRTSFYTRFYYHPEPLVLYRKHSDNISANKKRYNVLPLYLKKVIENQFVAGRVDHTGKRVLLQNISRMQLKMLKTQPGKVLKHMFMLNPFWFLNFGNLKLLAKKCLQSK